jgi:hypothetical protein
MKQQEVFKKIGVIIKELSDQYEYLKTIDGQLNELELELFIANSHFLTDHVVILNKLNAKLAPAPTPEPFIEEKPSVVEPVKLVAEELPPLIEAPEPVIEVVDTTAKWEPLIEAPEPVIIHAPVEEKPVEVPEPEPRYFEPLVQAVNQPLTNHIEDAPVPQIDLETGSEEDSYSYIRQEEPQTIRHELILDEADWEDEDETYETALTHHAVEEPVTAEPVVEESIIEAPPAVAKPLEIEHVEELRPVFEKPAPQIAREHEKDEVLTINERIMAQLASKGSNYTEQAGVQKIDDLKQAINLNDKLLYIKDLFNGYSLAYSEAIEILNRLSSFEEAETFLNKNYVAKNGWDSKPETTAKLYALLKRRYV